MNRTEAFKQGKALTPAESLQLMKKALNFEEWPLRRQQFVPGFSPRTGSALFTKEFTFQRERLLPIISSWVGRNYFYDQVESRSAFDLTVIVSQQSARDAADGLLLQMVYTQMHSEPRANFTNPPLGEVTIYRHPDTKQSIAFVRNNVAISIENYTSGRKQPDLEGIAAEIDRGLQESPTVSTLADDAHVPRITRFEPRSTVLPPGGRTDLEIEVKDDYPPLQYLFRVELGSYNLDPAQGGRWYFRAGPVKGKAELTLTVVNQINLMAESRCSIAIE
ncbi:MAG TPA: hypothetical protein VFN26_02545 [Candidatus Acidoferrum sp.]|nr:hypothetical protein [Candidatus Acidoferrum sp.]